MACDHSGQINTTSRDQVTDVLQEKDDCKSKHYISNTVPTL